jgi:hypothetical protein
VFPLSADRDRAKTAFKAEIEKWLAAHPRNRELLGKAELELDRIKAATTGRR